MNNKPPQLITAEDLRSTIANGLINKHGCPEHDRLNLTVREHLANDFNELIASKMKQTLCVMDGNKPWGLGQVQVTDNATHNILFTTWPIEEEEPIKCDVDHDGLYWAWKHQNPPLKLDPIDIVAQVVLGPVCPPCPKCEQEIDDSRIWDDGK